jgi:hypothetical protein
MDFVFPQQSEAAINSAIYDIAEGISNITLLESNSALKYIICSICIPTAAKFDVIGLLASIKDALRLEGDRVD